MKKISINQLKEDLSSYAEEVHNGEHIEITKYNEPYMRLVPAHDLSLRIGSRVGTRDITPILKKGSRGKLLKFLDEDRDG